LKPQDNREGLRALPLNWVECGKVRHYRIESKRLKTEMALTSWDDTPLEIWKQRCASAPYVPDCEAIALAVENEREAATARRQMKVKLRKAVEAKLSAREKDIYILHFQQGWSYQEISPPDRFLTHFRMDI